MAQTQGVLDVGRARWGRFQKSVAGSANVTLTQAEYENKRIEFTGALTGNINVVLPLDDGAEWTFLNSTTGAFTLTVIGATGTGIVLPRLTETNVYSDGTNILRSGSNVGSGVPLQAVTVGQGTPGLPVLYAVDVPAGATGDVDTVLTYKTRVVEVWLVKKNAAGGGAGTIQVKNGASAITDAMSINISDQIVARATSIDDSTWEIAAGGTLRITRTRTASTDETCTVFVLGVLVA